MFLNSKLAFGSELKKKKPTSFPKIDKRTFFLAFISFFGFYFFLDFKIYPTSFPKIDKISFFWHLFHFLDFIFFGFYIIVFFCFFNVFIFFGFIFVLLIFLLFTF